MDFKTVLIVISLLSLEVFGRPADVSDFEKFVENISDELEEGELEGEEVGGNFQGDMILNKEQERNLHFNPRNGLINERFRWPKENGKVTVSYMWKTKYPARDTNVIRQAMNEIERNSCVKFVENPQNPRAIKIHDGIGCSANVGMSDNNFVSLQRNWCLGKIGIPIHELLHSLGFHHMQSAFDRDDYVRVLRNNVQDKFLRNFDKFDSSYVSHFGAKYDLDSVMHYPKDSFTKSKRLNTLETVNPNELKRIGQRERLSQLDIEKLNKMYKC